MADDGITEAISIVLAPHYSTFSVKSYNGRAQDEAAKFGITINSVESWYDAEGFIDYWKEAILAEYEKNGRNRKKRTRCLLSLPIAFLRKFCNMVTHIQSNYKKTADLIKAKTGIKNLEIGWQSEGNTPDPWLGPDVQDLTRELYNEKGYRSFIYAPVGFVADHLEVLYDNDYECKVVCEELGANYYRPSMPNAHPKFIDTLATVVLNKYKSNDRS